MDEYTKREIRNGAVDVGKALVVVTVAALCAVAVTAALYGVSVLVGIETRW